MNIESKDKQMLQLNKYAREYINNYDNELDYKKITEQMREFSGAEYVMFFIFDEHEKDFKLVGFEGNKGNIKKAMDIIGYNIVGKKFDYEESIHERLEKFLVTRVEYLKELVYNELPDMTTSIIEKIFSIDHIIVVRISKNEKTIGSFNLIFHKNQIKNDDEMLKLFASQVGLFIDKKNSDQKIIEMKERLKNVIEGANIGTWEWNVVTGETIYNEKWAEMIGYKLEELFPTSFKTWEILTHPIDLVKSEKELRKVMNKESEYYDFELRMKHKNGKWIWMQDRGKVTKWSSDGKPILISGTIMDITEKKKQKQIEYLSFHDHLTGLYNRRYMEDSIERLDTSRSLPFSIIVLDVNGLKLTNDVYGHEIGDKLLIVAAEKLKKS